MVGSAFVVVAHRGHQGAAPESTIPAIDAALHAGFHHVELDVQCTSDGVPIILHDEELGRTVTGTGQVADHTWAQLRTLDAGSWWQPASGSRAADQSWSACRIPALIDVLHDYHGELHLHLELKSQQHELPNSVANALRYSGWVDAAGALSVGRVAACNGDALGGWPGLTITSFHIEQLRASKKLLPGVRHAWLVQELTETGVFEAAQAAGVTQLCPRADALTPEVVRIARQRGFSVRAWGLKRPDAVIQAVRARAHGGTADLPDVTAAQIAGLPPCPPPAIADFRSDTVTRPTPGMLAAMAAAPLGDDVWGDDPTVIELEATTAQRFGMEAALFFPSGTMANQAAIKVHTQPGDELICSTTAHIFCYEGGGIAANSGVQARTLAGDAGGRLSAAQVAAAVNPDDPHYPRTALVCLENTTNKSGGALYSLTAMQEISELCKSKGLLLHLDGARLFNAIVASQSSSEPYGPSDVGPLFDSISVCLSKGLGCPVGSVLLGNKAFIGRARRVRKLLGGGMRQVGLVAAAGLYALEHHVARLEEDHANAVAIGDALRALPGDIVEAVAPVSTNIVIWTVAAKQDPARVVRALADRSVHISGMGGRVLRFVTHLDVTEAHLRRALDAINDLPCMLHADHPGLANGS